MIPVLLSVRGMIYNTLSPILCTCLSFLHAHHLTTSCNVKCVQKYCSLSCICAKEPSP